MSECVCDCVGEGGWMYVSVCGGRVGEGVCVRV